MGKAEDGSVYGCVVFDSEINSDYVSPGDEGKYEGTLSEEHMTAAKNLVKLSRRHNFITLKMYGII